MRHRDSIKWGTGSRQLMRIETSLIVGRNTRDMRQTALRVFNLKLNIQAAATSKPRRGERLLV